MKVLYILLSYQLAALAKHPPTPSDQSTAKEEAWRAECGGSPPTLKDATIVLPPPILEPRPINETLVFILLMSRTAVRICDELNNTVVMELNKSQSIITENEVSSLDTLLPGKNAPGKRQVKTIIAHEITRLSRIGVFLELARNDTVEYKGKLTELERKVMEILCEMYQLMRVLKAKVTSQVTRDLVTSEYRDLDYKGRHARNFVITRASRYILYNLVERLQVITQMKMGRPLKKTGI